MEHLLLPDRRLAEEWQATLAPRSNEAFGEPRLFADLAGPERLLTNQKEPPPPQAPSTSWALCAYAAVDRHKHVWAAVPSRLCHPIELMGGNHPSIPLSGLRDVAR